jgi:predicted component of type VI protein secretion system
MKLSLVVRTAGKTEGKVIPITLAQFVIGRDPQCHLRPASPVISKRHCALLIRDDKAYVRDFESTNGTFVNDQPVKGEVELSHSDSLKVGPLQFTVLIEAGAPAPVNRPTPPPPTKVPVPAAAGSDDDIAAMLLSIGDDAAVSSGGTPGEVPEGSTVMDILAPPAPGAEGQGEAKGKEGEKPKAANVGNTSSAAKAILEKYMRRPRGS